VAAIDYFGIKENPHGIKGNLLGVKANILQKNTVKKYQRR